MGCTPIKLVKLKQYLLHYPNTVDGNILLEGFSNGFKLGYSGSRLPKRADNLRSAKELSSELMAKINKEVQLGRMIGPFPVSPFSNLVISPLGLVPKSEGGWRLIMHLSFPEGSSVNDGIDKDLCSVKYTSFDKVTDMIFGLGREAKLAKRDIKSAFRLLPVHPSDFHLLGMEVVGNIYVDKCLPMGCSISCSLFEKCSSFLHWLVADLVGCITLDHFLDDFIFAGKKDSLECEKLLSVFEATCTEVGIPIAEEKSMGPTTVLVFLGLEINSEAMSVRVPVKKIVELKNIISAMLERKKVTLGEWQSLVGKLCFVSQAIRSSRAFLRRFYDAMAGLARPSFKLRLSNEIKSDLRMWLVFLDEFNGVQFIPEPAWFYSDSLNLYTDSSGAAELGCGCFLDGKWSFFPWPENWNSPDIMSDMSFLEMVPVLLAIYLWGKQFRNKKIILRIDNEGLVKVLNKQSSKSKRLMQLVRQFVLMSMSLGIVFRAMHIPGMANSTADSISHKQWDRFRQLAPAAAEYPEPIPEQFLLQICALKLHV